MPERKVFRTFSRSESTSSCEYFHLLVMVVVVVVVVVVQDLQLWEGQRLVMSETVARLLLADIKS